MMQNTALNIKVCGMKDPQSIREINALSPDYLGLIFYSKSPRYVAVKSIGQELDPQIKKTGVFVNASEETIQQKIENFDLQAIQLHGQEPPEFCQNLKQACSRPLEIIKAFSIRDHFDFKRLQPYLESVDVFLFDTKGKHPGGNGVPFNWQILESYPYSIPFFLSGGIGLGDASAIQAFQQKNLPLYGVDVNSRFEVEPGVKNSQEVSAFIKQLRSGATAQPGT